VYAKNLHNNKFAHSYTFNYLRKSRYYQLMCIRPIQGQYVTIRNFDDSDPDSNWGKFFFLEISEVLVIVKRM